MENDMEQQNEKQKLIDIKKGTNITTKDIATQAQLRVSDVFTVEIGGCASWELAQKVVKAFNQLSGKHIRVDDLKFSPLHGLSSSSGNAVFPTKPGRLSLL
jgi:hypothetical protein